MDTKTDLKICQSCGMKMQQEDYGKNADGSQNKEYCKFCWSDGKFTKERTMEQQIESNLQFLEELNRERETKLTPEEARAEMMKYFPTLKRWKTNS